MNPCHKSVLPKLRASAAVSAAILSPFLLLGFLTAPPAMGATITYTGLAAGNLSKDWANRTNWSPTIVPTQADDVVINSGPVVLPQTAAFASLTLTGGQISGQFTNKGLMKWISGTIGGQITIAAGGTLELSGNDQKNLEESTINNSGTIRWGGTGGLQASTAIVINNQAGGLFEALTDSSIQHFSFSTPWVFNNAGVFRKSGGTNVTSISRVEFNNTGKVEIHSGTLSFATGLTSSGSFEVAAGAKLDLAGGKVALQSGSTITGAGFYGITGTVNVEGTINSANFQLTGILEGTNTLSGRMVWTTGTIRSKLTIAASGILELSGNDQKHLEESTINNSGTVRWGGTGGLQASTAIVINNQAGGLFEALTDSSIQHFSFSTPWVFNNAGVFRKSGGTNVTSISRVEFNNTGKVEIHSGTLSFATGLTSSGSFEVAAGAKLDLAGGKVALQSGSNITGAGFYGVTGTVNVDGTINSPNFQLTGILEGTNTLSGRMVWTTGTIRSKLTIAASGILELSGNDQKHLEESTINNSGTIRWNGTGGLQSSTAVVINNQAGGLFEAQSDTSIQHFSFSVPAVFNNAGTFRKSGGTNATTISRVDFKNQGTVEIQTGTLDFSSIYSQSAGATVLKGGTLKAAASINVDGGVLSGIGTVDGNVVNGAQVSPTTLAINGNYTQTAAGALNLKIGGHFAGSQYDTLTINGQAVLDGSLNLGLTNAFVPRPGDSFQVMTYSSRNGAFAKTNGLNLGGDLTLKLDLRPTSLVLLLPSPFTLAPTADGAFKVRFEGTAGVLYRMEASDDLVNWVLVAPSSLPGAVEFTDTNISSRPRRFYRVRSP